MQQRFLTLPARLLLAIILVCYSIVSYFIEYTLGGDWANWNHALGAVALVWYLVFFYRAHREVLLTGFYQIYYSMGMLLSAALVSGGMYMFEIARWGDQNGVFWVMMIYLVTGLESNNLGYRIGKRCWGGNVRKVSKNIEKALILLVVATAMIISAYVFLNYRGPILLGVDRVSFWRQFVPSYLSFVPTLVVQSFFFAAYYYLWSRRDRQKPGLPVLILAAYIGVGLFVLGEKLSLFMLFATTWFAILPGMIPNLMLKRSHMIMLAGVAALLVASVLVAYLVQGRDMDFALARIVSQAQVLWSVFDNTNSYHFWSDNWSCYFGCGQFTNGRELISYKYLPSNLYKLYSDQGSTLSGFMPALSIITMGLAASLLLHLVISFILGIIQQKIVVAIFENNIVYGFLLYKLHIGLIVVWFAALTTAIPGLIAVLVLIGLYHLCFPLIPAKKRWGSMRDTLAR